MLFNVYIIGLVIMIIWWGLLAFLVFEESVYNKLDDETKNSIDELHETLTNFNTDNIQLVYLLLSFFACIFWPIVLPYMLYKRFFG
jgi:hypothetical protein